jgi:hypothetical protein
MLSKSSYLEQLKKTRLQNTSEIKILFKMELELSGVQFGLKSYKGVQFGQVIIRFRVQFLIYSMISGQNCMTRSSITFIL